MPATSCGLFLTLERYVVWQVCSPPILNKTSLAQSVTGCCQQLPFHQQETGAILEDTLSFQRCGWDPVIGKLCHVAPVSMLTTDTASPGCSHHIGESVWPQFCFCLSCGVLPHSGPSLGVCKFSVAHTPSSLEGYELTFVNMTASSHFETEANVYGRFLRFKAPTFLVKCSLHSRVLWTCWVWPWLGWTS